MNTTGRSADWGALLDNARELCEHAQPLAARGRLTRVRGMTLEASGISLPIGSICQVEAPVASLSAKSESTAGTLDAEVLGFGENRLLLMPTQSTTGLTPGAGIAPVEPVVRRPRLRRLSHAWARQTDQARHLPIGPGLLGRIVDARGSTLDELGDLGLVDSRPIRSRPINAMKRHPIRQALDTGVRAINTMLTVGRGQRLGLFAGAGVGKSVLLGMMARHTDADVIVVGLIGERGREVREFVDEILGPSGRHRAAVVVAPADEPALLKIQAANYACAVAEYFRDQGLNVLLLMDSLTRYAMALREVSLAMGEAPATRGYPASVFARLPELIERAGNSAEGSGSITGFYTVLIEGDDLNDPVGDSARSHLDGHIVLSRDLADAGHFPAIAIEASVSRVMMSIAEPEHLQATRLVRQAWAAYQQNRDLISLGAYVSGADPVIDQAIAAWPAIADLMTQDMNARGSLAGDVEHLQRVAQLLSPSPAANEETQNPGEP